MDSNTLIDAIENTGYSVERYSGRGMFGEYCVGLVTREGIVNTLATLIGEYARSMANDQDDVAKFCDLLVDASTDNMGCDNVIYWRSLSWPRDRVVKDDEEEEE